MPKQVIVIMDDHYPFGQCQQSTNQNTKVLVRKIYQVSVQQRHKLLQKSNILKRLKCDQIIKLESVLEEEESIHFLFEYVPIRLQTWISNINDQFIQNFRDQVIKFSSFLANNYIKIDFKLKNIGMDHNYGAKYFLDPTFTYDPSLNKQKLKSQYIRDISNLFKPYIESSQQQQQGQFNQDSSSVKNSDQYEKSQPNNTKSKNSAISPPTYDQEPTSNQPSNKTKEKLEKYYQHMNASMDVENEKILQEFMDVLDDEEEEVQPKVTQNNASRQVPAQYQYGYDSREEDRRKSQQPTRNQQPPQQQFKQPAQNVFQNNQPNMEQPKQKAPSSLMMPPPKMTKNSQMVSQHAQDEQQVVWRDTDDLQDRIKKAIQNSKSIINRFKSFKQNRS